MATQLETYTITRGNPFNILLRFEKPGTPAVGETPAGDPTPEPLSIYDNIRADIRERASYTSRLIFRKELGDGITVSGDDNDNLLIEVSAEDSALFDDGTYYYDIVFYVGSNPFTQLKGGILITLNISEND
jgi:hypothetical protein